MREDPSILELASLDPSARRRATEVLFSRGSALIAPILAGWLADAEFRGSIGSNPPQPTVGVAVVPDTFQNIRAANGNPRLAEVPPDQDAIEFELEFNGVQLDILTTKLPGGTGAIARFGHGGEVNNNSDPDRRSCVRSFASVVRTEPVVAGARGSRPIMSQPYTARRVPSSRKAIIPIELIEIR